MQVDRGIEPLAPKPVSQGEFLENASVENVNPVDVGVIFEQRQQRPLEDDVDLRIREPSFESA
jgi:hypothetical protein